MKHFIEQYNIKIITVGTAIVLSSIFGKCSYDYKTGEVEVSANPADVVEVVKSSNDEVTE